MPETNPVEAKPWWQSRIIMVNAIAAGLVVLEANTGLLQPLLPVNLYVALAAVLPVVNAMLRVVTNQPISRAGDAGSADLKERAGD